MHLKNLTDFPFATKVTSLRPPQLMMMVVVRGKFTLTPGRVTPPVGTPQLAQGMLSGARFAEDDEAMAGALERASDFADFKPRADILLHGSCYTPGGRPMPRCPVELRVGAWRKALLVSGDRAWGGALGGRPSPPAPFTRMPLDWAHAFGGPGHPLNPAGKGIAGRSLPNVEDPRAPIRSKRDRPAPASFAPINPLWPQRQRLRGEHYGPSWRRERAPFYADDFDWRYFNAAPPDQQIEGYLRGDEELTLQNLTPGRAVLQTRLPGLRVRCFVSGRAGFRGLTLKLDTLTIDTDDDALYLAWRGLLDVEDAEFDDIDGLLVSSEALAEPPRPLADYEAVMTRFLRDPLELEERLGLEDARMLELVRDDSLDEAARASACARLIRERAGDEAIEEFERRDPEGLDLEGRIKRQLARREDDERPQPVMHLERPRVFLRGDLEEVARRIAAARERLPDDADTRALDEAEAKLGDAWYQSLDPTYRPPGAPPPADDLPGPGANLAYRDLSGAELRGADLSGANLEGALLLRATLAGASLRGANLRGAMLFRADLTEADLTEADLALAHLGRARLQRASLERARLDETFFDEADLTGARLSGARGRHAFFNKATLTGATARSAELPQAKFEGATLERADFEGATLEQALFANARGRGARFHGARLARSTFIKAELPESVFTWVSGERTNWNECVLDGADLSYAELPRSFFIRARAPGARFVEGVFTETRFTKALLSDADFSGAKLVAAELVKARIDRVMFKDANLFEAHLLAATGAAPNFMGANLKRSSLDT